MGGTKNKVDTMAFQQGDFIKLHYTGRLSDGTVFDTTDENVAKAAGITGTRSKMGPVTVCLGEGHILPGLERALISKSVGKHTVQLTAEQGFGKKSAKLLRLVPLRQFKEQRITPQPGMELNIDGEYGVVRAVSGGRIIVDFNHPLANQDLTYDVEILGGVEDKKEQVRAILDISGLPYEQVAVEGTHAVIKVKMLYPQQLIAAVQERIMKLTGLTAVSFEAGDRKPGVAKEKSDDTTKAGTKRDDTTKAGTKSGSDAPPTNFK